MIRLIIFDFSGTLAYYDSAEYHEVFNKLRDFNLPIKEGKTAKELAAILPEFFSESSSWEDLTNKVIQKLGIILEQDRREQLAAYLQRKLACKLFSDVENILTLPQDKAILTLSDKFVVDSIPELRNFEVFSPKIAAATKPDLKAFLAVLEKMQADPAEAIMVGDSLESDILPAKSIGMQAILIDRDDKIKLNDPSIIKIKSLKELKRFL